MDGVTEPDWLDAVRRLDALARSGLAYDPHQYDRERYEAVAAIAAELLALGSMTPAGAWLDQAAAEPGHVTPKLDVRGAVFRDGRVLLVRELVDGLFTLPGGWADVGETPREAVEREVREETGLEVRATKLCAVLDRRLHGHPSHRWHSWKLFFACRVVGGAVASSFETADAGFHALDALPPLSLGRVTPSQLTLLARHDRDPARPTDFD